MQNVSGYRIKTKKVKKTKKQTTVFFCSTHTHTRTQYTCACLSYHRISNLLTHTPRKIQRNVFFVVVNCNVLVQKRVSDYFFHFFALLTLLFNSIGHFLGVRVNSVICVGTFFFRIFCILVFVSLDKKWIYACIVCVWVALFFVAQKSKLCAFVVILCVFSSCVHCAFAVILCVFTQKRRYICARTSVRALNSVSTVYSTLLSNRYFLFLTFFLFGSTLKNI